MAEFDGGKVVVVPMPVTPDMVVWALPGPTGDIPYQDVENLVEAEFDDRIVRMEALESDTEGHASDAEASAGESEDFATLAQGFAQDSERSRDDAQLSAGDAAGSASTASSAAQTVTDNLDAIDAAPGHASAAEQARTDAEGFRDSASGYASDAAGSASEASSSASSASQSASDAEGSADAAASSASAAASSAGDADRAASTASGHAGRAADSEESARTYAEEFDLTVSSETGAPGTQASVTVTGDGPAYTLGFTVPRGDKGDDGEVSQAALDSAVASLVDGSPEALNTLAELATALGNDPNFATTVSTEIGKRVLIDGAPAAYDTLGKLVTALQNHELGGSTDASLLTGALTDQVDASSALVSATHDMTGPLTMPLSELLFGMLDMSANMISKGPDGFFDLWYGMLSYNDPTEGARDIPLRDFAVEIIHRFLALEDGKADTTHTHDGADITGALTDQVDASEAMVQAADPNTGEPSGDPFPSGVLFGLALSGMQQAIDGLATKADIGHTHIKAEVGLDQVDNTSDVDKPVSTATQTALDGKADQADLDDKIRLVTQFPSNPTPGVLYLKAED